VGSFQKSTELGGNREGMVWLLNWQKSGGAEALAKKISFLAPAP
jgi:hypothetical protein